MILVRDPNNGCFDSDKAEVSAYYFPAECCEKGDSLKEHLTTVDDIEAKTGIDFFSALEDKLEERLESVKPKSVWKKADWE